MTSSADTIPAPSTPTVPQRRPGYRGTQRTGCAFGTGPPLSNFTHGGRSYSESDRKIIRGSPPEDGSDRTEMKARSNLDGGW